MSLPTASEFIDILLDIATEEHGSLEARLEALDIASLRMSVCQGTSTRYPHVHELVGSILVKIATDTAATLQERVHAARLISQYGYTL